MTLLTSFLSLVVVAMGSGGADPAPTGVLGQLQGTWVARTGPKQSILVRLELNGRTAKFTVELPAGLTIEAEGQVQLNEAATPKTVDWINFHGPDEQELPVIPAIYRLDAKTFVVCSGGLNNGRPKEFTPGEGLLSEVVTFSRVEAGPSVAEPAAQPIGYGSLLPHQSPTNLQEIPTDGGTAVTGALGVVGRDQPVVTSRRAEPTRERRFYPGRRPRLGRRLVQRKVVVVYTPSR